MSTSTLRLVNKEDLFPLANVFVNAYNALNINEHWDDKSALNLLQFFYHEQPDLFFVAENDATVVGGVVAIVRPWWDGNHLIDGELFVNPDDQKKGIGMKLIKKLFMTAKEKYQVISWDTYTHTFTEHPLNWYKNLGFEEIKHWTMITGDVEKVLVTLKDK